MRLFTGRRYLDGSWGLEAPETATSQSHKSNTANDAKLKPGGRPPPPGGAWRDSLALQRWLENLKNNDQFWCSAAFSG